MPAADLSNSSCFQSKFLNCLLEDKTCFNSTYLSEADFNNTKISIEQLKSCSNLSKIKNLEPQIMKELEDKHPDLLKDPYKDYLEIDKNNDEPI